MVSPSAGRSVSGYEQGTWLHHQDQQQVETVDNDDDTDGHRVRGGQVSLIVQTVTILPDVTSSQNTWDEGRVVGAQVHKADRVLSQCIILWAYNIYY